MKKINLSEVQAFMQSAGPDTKIYIGGDSERFISNGVWYADYTLVIVMHINGKHGCKIFGEIHRERDFDQKQDRPRMRLMNEVYKIAELYLRFHEMFEDRDIEVHLDINPKEMYGSNCVINEAIGYIRGMCNVIPMVKPRAFAASCAADRYKDLKKVNE